jgi:hypothetical protein
MPSNPNLGRPQYDTHFPPVCKLLLALEMILGDHSLNSHPTDLAIKVKCLAQVRRQEVSDGH